MLQYQFCISFMETFLQGFASAIRGGKSRRCAGMPVLASMFFMIINLCGTGTALAQNEMRNSMPETGIIDPDIDPDPFDPLRAIRNHLTSNVGARWWFDEPMRLTSDAYFVVVHVPDIWHGNPVSAIMALCPEPDDPIWGHLERIELQPFYLKRPWAIVTCRR